MYEDKLKRLLLVAALWTWSATAHGREPETIEITYDEALALARSRAPASLMARAAAREASSQIDAASVRPFNPQLQAAAGPRFGTAGTVLDWQIGAQQWLELGGQRGDRLAVARAGAAAGEARSDDAQRRLLREVSLAFIAAVFWERRVVLAEENLEISRAIAAVARRRHEVGDVGGLEAAASTLAVARAQSDLDRARASVAAAEGRLEALLGVEPSVDLSCRGDLRTLGTLAAGEADIDQRPDVRALRAEIDEAEAETELGRASRVPNVAVGARYNREELDHRVQGTLTVELPTFNRGQGTSATARARRDRLEAELRVTRTTAAIETKTSTTLAHDLSEAARRFEEVGLVSLEGAETLASASYAAGQIPLGELLAIRRELVGARLDHAQLLLEAAIARVELAASTGALR